MIISNIDAKTAADFDTKEDVGVYVNNIVEKIKGHPEISDALGALFDLNIDNMSPDEAKEKVEQYIKFIAGILDEDENELKVGLS